jgi:predicted GNAT family acetyltransferase
MMKPLSVKTFDNAEDFLSAAGPLLYEQEAINGLMLGICERLVRKPTAYKDPFFSVVEDGAGVIHLAATMTPPHNMVLADGKDSVSAMPVLIENLIEHGVHVPGVTGPVHLTEAFSASWQSATGKTAEVTMRQRVYELREVRMPPLPPGNHRVARIEDIPTIMAWYEAFVQESMHMTGSLTPEQTERMVNENALFVWDNTGELVSIAMKTRPLAHSISVSFVYTPPEYRRRGFATALVARLSQHLLDLGYASVTLFTDLDFPTSNAIYQKIGYRPVTDFRMVSFKS